MTTGPLSTTLGIDTPTRWSPTARAIFRFIYSYIAIYALYGLTNAYGFMAFPFLKGRFVFPVDAALKPIVPWVATHILLIHQPITYNLSGDSSFSWVEHFIFLVLALLIAITWSILDRERPHYRAPDQWLRLLVRLSLAAIMFGYGFDKVFPIQFHSITRASLVEPLGSLSHFRLMWNFMAASKPYTIFSGLLEVAAGILLLIPALTNIGALFAVVVMSNVVALNFAYNIPVKLHSSNYLFMAIFLVAPLLPRLVNVLILNREVPPVTHARLSSRKNVDRTARIVLATLGFLIFFVFFFEQRAHYAEIRKTETATAPLQGIWQVDQFTSTDPQHPLFTPFLADQMNLHPPDDRWSRLIFDQPNQLVIQVLSGELDYVDLNLDKTATHATLSDSGDDAWKATLTFDQPQPNRLHFQGTVNGATIEATLHRLDESHFPLNNEPLHLINR